MWKQMIVFSLVIYILEAVANPEPKPLSTAQNERLASWRYGEQNMWELSGQTEGDMVLLPQQTNGLIDKQYKWENNEIPYELSPVFSELQASIIHETVKEFRAKSSVTVRPRISTDIDYVYVTAENTGCWSNVGRLGGIQSLNLQIDGCLTKPTIIHEFLHTAGFFHQNSASERDNYIDIIWSNVQKGEEDDLEKYGGGIITHVGTPYDYGSIMHYSENAFSANGHPTIVPRDVSWIGKLGTAREMSDIDVEKLNEMYDDEDNRLWMWIGIGAAILVVGIIAIAICSWCCCLTYCLTCCCCFDCCSCLEG